ncbi:MAG: LysR family transcriptional regulator [Myxococcota bacterium]
MASRALSSFDLNLLVQLDLLLEESSVSAAAARAGITQSAMSRALGRLRDAFDDELLVQVGRGMERTSVAEGLVGPLRAVLRDIDQQLLSPRAFDPSTAELEFRIAAVDFAEVLLCGPLLQRLRTEAPGITLHLTGAQEAFRGGLSRGELDLALGVLSGARASIKGRRLLSDTFSCALRTQHPAAADGALTVEAMQAHPHVLVSPSGRGNGQVDAALAALGGSRHVAARVGSFSVGLQFVAENDLLLTAPTRIARRFAELDPRLKVVRCPLQLESLTLSMLWHATRHGDPAHAWLRSQLVAEAERLA